MNFGFNFCFGPSPREIRKDKRAALLKTVDENLDLRDQWLGRKRMKTEYKAKVYALKTDNNTWCEWNRRADTLTKHFAKEPWGHKPLTDYEEEQLQIMKV